MTDYTELVKALRCCAEHKYRCLECEFMHDGVCSVMHDAAAAIEALQAEVKRLKESNEELQQIADHHEQTAKDYWKEACEYKAQLPKRGEWIMNDNGTWSCSLCQSWIPNQQHYYARYCLCCGAKMEDA